MTENQHLMVTFKSRPGHEADLKNVLLELVRESRTEPGCIRYDLEQSSANPELFFLVECWASENSLIGHQQTLHFLEGIKKIEALTAHTGVHFINWVEPTQ